MDEASSSNSSKISTITMYRILDDLQHQKNRKSMKNNYLTVWKLFNTFLIKLDTIPRKWEDRIYLFLAHLANHGRKSTTLRSYYSAIKSVLADGEYKLQDDGVQLNTLSQACKLHNDQIQARLPIRLHMLEMILFELNRNLMDQPYLNCLYRALFAVAYYGLLRIGECAQSPHVIKAADVHIVKVRIPTRGGHPLG